MHGYDFKMEIAEGRIVLHPTSSNVSDKEIPIDICLLFTFEVIHLYNKNVYHSQELSAHLMHKNHFQHDLSLH